MCGITGIYAFNGKDLIEPTGIDDSLRKIAHRGPDNKDIFTSKKIHLGHVRLSIIDVSENGNQPMQDASGRYVIVYNGECYNHRDLRSKLSSKGIKFKSESDTESVLYWLIDKGPEGLKDLNGFFSLALYDSLNRKLLLARDRFGIKPMYYRINSEYISFSSEMKGIISEKNEINQDSLNAYNHLNYIPSPHSIYREVKKLPPGTYLNLNHSGQAEMHRFYSPHYGAVVNNNQVKKSIHEKLEESVLKRLMSDVPIGCFLSGGLDSSIITGIASKHQEKLKTYTLVFKGEDQYDESKDASLVAKHFNTEHHEIEIDEKDLIESVDHILNNVDEPFADSSAIAMFNLCKSVSKDVKVALSGDGGDELFAGYRKHLALYNSYRFPHLSKFLSRGNSLLTQLPSSREKGLFNSLRKWQKFTSAASLPAEQRYWEWAGYGNPSPTLIKENDFQFKAFLNEIHTTKMQSFQDCLKMDQAMVLEGDMLVKTDRMSMLNGLEVRVPFLDHEFVEIINRVPAKKKIGILNKKKLLKESFKDLLPNEILNKGKHGFEVPLKKWLQNDLSDKVSDLLEPGFIEHQGIFNLEAIKDLKKLLHSPQSSNSEYTIWAIMVFNSWWKSQYSK